MRKSSVHIVKAAQTGLERMTSYVSSSLKRMQIGDFIFPEDKVPPRIKTKEDYKKLINLFNTLSEAVKDVLSQAIEDQKQLQKKENGVIKVEDKDGPEEQGQRINQEIQEALLEERRKYEGILQEKSEELENLKKDLEKEKNLRKEETGEEGKAREIEENAKAEIEAALEIQKRTERLNQELQEALKEETRVLRERTEELQKIKEALEAEKSKNQTAMEEVLDAKKREEGKNQHIQKDLDEVRRNLQEKTDQLHEVEEALEREKRRNEDKMGQNHRYRNETARAHSIGESRSRQTWLVEHTLNEDESRTLREKMTQLYDAPCKSIKADIVKLLDAMHYNEIKKHELFSVKVASKMERINRLLSEGNENVDAEYRKLVSMLEEERARLQKLLNSSVLQEDSHQRGTLKKIESIMRNIEELEGEVDVFQGTKEDKTFLDLEHKLLSNVMKLDVIQTMGCDAVRKKKTEAVTYATNCMEKLDANVIEDA